VLPRAHAKTFSGARQHDDKEKICKKICCYDQKQQPPFFSYLLFFVAIGCSNKKDCQNVAQQKRKLFCLENFSQKFFPTSLVTLVTGGRLIWIRPMYLHHIHTYLCATPLKTSILPKEHFSLCRENLLLRIL